MLLSDPGQTTPAIAAATATDTRQTPTQTRIRGTVVTTRSVLQTRNLLSRAPLAMAFVERQALSGINSAGMGDQLDQLSMLRRAATLAL